MITKEELDDIRLMYDSGHPLVMKMAEETERHHHLIKGMMRFIKQIGIYDLEQVDVIDRQFYIERSKEYDQ
jgi:uncharacterized protein Smg (DUF494 family)